MALLVDARGSGINTNSAHGFVGTARRERGKWRVRDLGSSSRQGGVEHLMATPIWPSLLLTFLRCAIAAPSVQGSQRKISNLCDRLGKSCGLHNY